MTLDTFLYLWMIHLNALGLSFLSLILVLCEEGENFRAVLVSSGRPAEGLLLIYDRHSRDM